MDAVSLPLVNALGDSNIVYADGAWSGPPFPLGQYAFARSCDSGILLLRDPLGCSKLFYGRNGSGALVLANRIDRALDLGVMLDDLASVPPGHLLRINDAGVHIQASQDLTATRAADQFDLGQFHRDVAATLAEAFQFLSRRFAHSRFVVCLSGGLDSALIADFACRHLRGHIYAASFSYVDDADQLAWLNGTAAITDLKSVSADFRAACRVADALRIPLIPVLRPASSVLGALGPAVRLGQDFRDFNVHCAIVNLFLAETIRARFPGESVVALTGDLMNEYVCDYQEEKIGGVVYYRQPRVPHATRRRFLLRGLDAGDREIGVFGAFGLQACQVYATLAQLYVRLPPQLLEDPGAKRMLNGPLLRAELLEHVNLSKQRAQTGGPDGGTLGLLHKYQIAAPQMLKDLWARSLPEAQRGDDPWDLIQIGRYRTGPRRGGSPQPDPTNSRTASIGGTG
jgi:hypothetical protein